MRVPGWSVVLVAAACATVPDARQGGAEFKAVARKASLPAEALFEVCWPKGAVPGTDGVKFEFPEGGSVFTLQGGASNSTGRCLREIIESYPWSTRPTQPLVVSPSGATLSGWAVLAWVGLLSPGLFGPDRGVLEPAGLVAGCLGRGTGLRAKLQFVVRHEPTLSVALLPAAGQSGALTDTERCVEAVLGSTVWPNTREFAFAFEGRAPAATPDVGLYFHPDGEVVPLDPQRTKDALSTRQGAIATCWNQALARRAGLHGGRTVRLRVDGAGAVSAASVAGNSSNEPATAADYLLDRCLVDVVKTASFGGAGAGETVYSWVFAERR